MSELLSNLRKGVWAETRVLAELLKRNHDVYKTLCDDRGIDFVIKLNNDQYLDIQVKGSTDKAKRPYFFVFKWNKKSRQNYFFVFYVQKENVFWIIPTDYMAGKDGKEISNPDKNGYCSIDFDMPKHREMYKDFKDNWEILKQ